MDSLFLENLRHSRVAAATVAFVSVVGILGCSLSPPKQPAHKVRHESNLLGGSPDCAPLKGYTIVGNPEIYESNDRNSQKLSTKLLPWQHVRTCIQEADIPRLVESQLLPVTLYGYTEDQQSMTIHGWIDSSSVGFYRLRLPMFSEEALKGEWYFQAPDNCDSNVLVIDPERKLVFSPVADAKCDLTTGQVSCQFAPGEIFYMGGAYSIEGQEGQSRIDRYFGSTPNSGGAGFPLPEPGLVRKFWRCGTQALCYFGMPMARRND